MNKYHNDRNGDAPMSRGMKARVAQVQQADREIAEFRRENPGRGATGSVSLKKQREVAERALERQVRYARGQYPVR